MRAERDEPHYNTRAGRLDKWKELVASSQKELQIPVAAPERLMILSLKGTQSRFWTCVYRIDDGSTDPLFVSVCHLLL